MTRRVWLASLLALSFYLAAPSARAADRPASDFLAPGHSAKPNVERRHRRSGQDDADADRDRPLLLDVREPWEFQTCHIAGSVSMPMALVPIRQQELPDERPLVCICHHGARSLKALEILKGAGYAKVRSLAGGIDAWAERVEPGMARY